MYGKMEDSGLAEITPLICTSAAWGQWTVLSHPEPPLEVQLGGCSSSLLDGLVSIPSSLRGHHLSSWSVMIWWLQHPLFTDMAGNILVLSNYVPLCLWVCCRMSCVRGCLLVPFGKALPLWQDKALEIQAPLLALPLLSFLDTLMGGCKVDAKLRAMTGPLVTIKADCCLCIDACRLEGEN